MSNKNFIYILPEYTNKTNLKNIRSQDEDEYSIKYIKDDLQIELRETNSLIENEYCLNLKSAKYVVEGTTETKESMIHHHTKGHISKHLQFKLKSKNETIRITLEFIDLEDYKRCIQGFLHISQELIEKEKAENKITENLQNYFFNKDIEKLAKDRIFLLEHISQAFSNKLIITDDKNTVDKAKLLELQKETHLSPFFNWIF